MTDPVLQESADDPSKLRLVANRPVFFGSAILILAFALFGAIFSETAGQVFDRLQALIVADFGWFYILTVAGFLIFELKSGFCRLDTPFGGDIGYRSSDE